MVSLLTWMSVLFLHFEQDPNSLAKTETIFLLVVITVDGDMVVADDIVVKL